MIKKVKFIILFSILFALGLCTQSQARITTTDPTVESGGTATITINSQEAVANGAIDVTNSGGLTFSSVSGGTAKGTKVAFAGTENKKSGLATYKFKVPTVSKTTTYKVTFASVDMGTAEGETVASSTATATVTVKAKSTSSSNNSSSSGNSGSSSGNSGTQTTSAPSFSSVNETVYATGSVNVRSSYSTSSSIVGSLDAGDSVTRTGRGSNGWSRVTYNGQTAYISSEYLTTEKPEESDNNNLESLSISGYELTPKFSADVKEYSLTITEDVEKLDITAEPEDKNAEVKIEGNENLLIGENTIKIIVTAEDGTERTYTLNVTKGETPPVGLSELSIAGYKLTPEFSSDIYEYTLDISDTSVTSVDITAKSDTEDAIIEIVGNNDLKLGENVITVLVKSENEEQTSTYQITVNIAEPVPDAPAQIIPGLDNTDLYIYIGCGVVVLIVLIIIIVVAVKHKRNKEDEYVDYYGGLDFSDDSERDKKSKSKKKKEDSPIEEDIQTNQEENTKVEETIGAGMNDNYMQNFDDEDKPRRRGKHF